MIYLAVVDDHSLMLQGLELMFREEADIHLNGLYQNGPSLLAALKGGERIDLILMDIHMPDTNGIELCKAVKKAYPEVKVIGLSMVSKLSLVKLMIRNGASGYLHKNAGKEEVLLAVRRVANGKKYFSEDIASLLLGDARPSRSNRSPFPALSRREKEVLQLITDEKTTQEIADELFISFGTVETHRRNILSKLGARNTAGLVRIALEYNLLGE